MRRNTLTHLFKSLTNMKLVGSFDLDEEQTRRVAEAQYESTAKLTTVAILACLLNAMVLVLSFWESSLSRALLVWGGVICLALSYMAFVSYRRARKPICELDIDKEINGFVRAATALGLLWGIVPLIAIPLSDSFGVTASGMLLTGTMFGAVLLMGRIPQAAMSLVLPIVFGIIAGLQFQQDPRNNFLTVMTLAYAGVLYFASRLAYSQFVEQHLGQIALEDKTELVGLLLRDFEESTSDWLWQTDAEGRVVPTPSGSQRQIAKRAADMLDKPLLDTLEDCTETRALADAMRERRPFRDLVVPIANLGTETWWAFSGKPIFEKGQFVGFRGVASDVTQSKISEDRIAFLAHFDVLTALPTREKFKQAFHETLVSKGVDLSKYALVSLDLDHFKWVNEAMGHQAGDEVLRLVAERIREYACSEDLMTRVSGDEFAFMVTHKGYEDLNALMDEAAKGFAAPYMVWDSSVVSKASMGVKILMPGMVDMTEALKHADMARASAKEKDKGNWALFDHRLAERANSLRELEVDLNKAIDQDELRLMFQPLVDATTHDVVAVETLLRWQHPRRGLLTPDTFIEFAEDNGIIARIGNWVIRNALEQARSFPEHIRIAINVSPLQIHSSSLLPTLVNALAATGISPDRVELEITESVMISDTETTLERLQQLKEFGLRIALDDFGTGFSSLSYLRQFPFDKLKIDKSFTQDISTSEDSRAIANATLQLARALGMKCVGEGVETPQQANFLRDHGCAELQGYMFSRPLALADLGHLIDLDMKPPRKAEPKPASSPLKLVGKSAEAS